MLFGVGLPDENAHAPDEKLDLGNFHNGIIASAFLYGEVGSLSRVRVISFCVSGARSANYGRVALKLQFSVRTPTRFVVFAALML